VQWRIAMRYAALVMIVLLLATMLAPVKKVNAQAYIYVVNSISDAPDVNPGDGIADDGSGICTLRAAIMEANSTPDTTESIYFNIPDDGPYTIQPVTPLPIITSPVFIDGTTQPGWTGSPVIELDGSNAGSDANGLEFNTSSNSTVQGLVINRFSGNGISIMDGDGTVIRGNFIGTDISGNDICGNKNGIYFLTDNTIIGGTSSTARNVISGNNWYGIKLGGIAGNNQILGNYIGINAAGNASLPNKCGIRNEGGFHNSIGSTTPGSGNVISGNTESGIHIGTTISNPAWTTIRGNYIGTDASGLLPIGNGGSGIETDINTSYATIGGIEPGAGNLIAFNEVGVAVFWKAGGMIGAEDGHRNAILGNSIHSNTGLGIDLWEEYTEYWGVAYGEDWGVTLNDTGDTDYGPNKRQNFPVLTSIIRGIESTNITGGLNSISDTQFRIEFFSNSAIDPTFYGEGETYLGFTTITTDAGGDAVFNAELSVIVPQGRAVTATATDPDGNTSEFSAYIGTVPPAVETETASNITMSGATLHGNLTSPGTSPAVNVYFEYGLTEQYGSVTTPQEVTQTGPFGASISSLLNFTEYHFRAVADAVDHGITRGDDMTFTTLKGFPQITGISPDYGFRNSTVNITITGNNFYPGAGAKLVQAGQPDIIAGNVNVISLTQITCSFNLTGMALGYWDVQVKVDNNVSTKSFKVAGVPTIVTIGQGTELVTWPMGASYDDQRTQALYLGSEISMGGIITALSLYVYTPPMSNMNNWTIRMKTQGSQTTVPTTWVVSGAWGALGYQYQANESAGAAGWKTFTFPRAFNYNGTDSITVDFSFNNDGTNPNPGQCLATDYNSIRVIHAESYSNDGNPLNWSGLIPTPVISDLVPNIRLTIAPLTGCMLTTNVTPASSGTVTPNGGLFDTGTQINLVASPAQGWKFDHWEGDIAGTDMSVNITMSSNRSVTAVFTKVLSPGDANGDGVINVLDITTVARMILERIEETPEADANRDGFVDVFDITKIARIILGRD
jgi:CSLREA domain-containing protein